MLSDSQKGFVFLHVRPGNFSRALKVVAIED
jgi:hypothetical protein